MPRISLAAALLLAALAVGSCEREPNRIGLDVGRHHVRLTVPRGWEHLDHGREQLFRNGETELRLTDYRPDSVAARSAGQLVWWVTEQTDPHAAGREIERQDSLAIHGTWWVRVATWSRLSHMDARPTAFAVADSGLLVLSCERGPIERASGAFDSLLASIEVLPGH